VAVKIRLKRLGKIRAPYYRVVVADSRTKRDGRAIEEIGKYHPTEEPSLIDINSARAQYWLSVGAQPTEQVLALLKVTGDWQKFKGEPGAEGTLRVAAPKVDKRAVFEAAAKESMGESTKDGATTAKARKPAKKAAAAPAAEAPAAEAPAAEAPAAEAPAAEAPAAEAPAAEAPAAEAPAADEGAPGGSETSEQTATAAETAPAEG
jgi:small subunit ribosomal protein S16